MDNYSTTEKMKGAAENVTEKLQQAGEKIQNQMSDLWETSRDKAGACAKATDHAIRENPYQALGIALGIGVIAGMLLNRRRAGRKE